MGIRDHALLDKTNAKIAYIPAQEQEGIRVLIQSNVDQLLVDALIGENLELLDVICQGSTLVGDAAAIASKGILKILDGITEKTTIVFLKRILKFRILDYRINLHRANHRTEI